MKVNYIYAQNVDALERCSGIPDELIVEAHGSFANAHCATCYKSYPAKYFRDTVISESVPFCTEDTCDGCVKPDIVFFGERLTLFRVINYFNY